MTVGFVSGGGVADIVLCAGQSNAGDGNNSAADLPASLLSSDDRQLIWGGSNFVKMVNGTNTNPLGPSGLDCWGPECQFAKRWITTFSKPIHIVKYAFTGSQLGGSANNSWNPANTGQLFDLMTTYVTAAKATRGNYKVRALLWMQGESDAEDSTMAADYATNLAAFITKVRTTWGDAQTKILIGRISTYPYNFPTAVRTAQASVVDSITKMIDTDNYPRLNNGFHYTGDSQKTFGDDLFNAYTS